MHADQEATTPTRIRALQADEYTAATRLLVAAFFTDPLICHIFPDSTRRRIQLAWYMDAALRLGTRMGSVLVCAEPLAAVLVYLHEATPVDWLRAHAGPPPDAAIDFGVLTRLRACANATRRLRARFAAEEHIYGLLLASDDEFVLDAPAAALVRHLITEAAAARHPIYLETTRRTNLRYFGRLGFTVVAEGGIRDGPPLWLMRGGAAG